MAEYTDLLIVGAGPAGLTAAVYAGRAGKTVRIIEKETFGGQITHSPRVENFPGVIEASGAKIGEMLLDQAVNLGAEIELDQVLSAEKTDLGFKVVGESAEYYGKTLIIAAGSRHRMMGVDREEELTGAGISYCAVCDGAFYAGKNIAVIGGGNTALQEAVELSAICNHVTVVQNLAFLTGEEKLQQKLAKADNVDFIYSAVVSSLEGEDHLTALILNVDGKPQRLGIDGIFVAVGQQPDNEAFASLCELDKNGFIVAGESCETSVPGVYAAGDCRTKTIRQAVTACADGAVAALAACRFIG